MIATIVKLLDMFFIHSSVGLDIFFFWEFSTVWKVNGVLISSNISFWAASINWSLSHSSFQSKTSLSFCVRIYIRLCSHSSGCASITISDSWMVFTFFFSFQKTRSITNQLYFRFSISNQADLQFLFPMALLTSSIAPLLGPKCLDSLFTLTLILFPLLGRRSSTLS